MSDARVLWLWLHAVMGACNEKSIRLVREFDYIERLYERRQSSDMAKLLSPQEYKNARTVRLEDCEALANECDALGIRILCYSDEEYPEMLRNTRVPPAVLFCTGDVRALTGTAIAGVGARLATKYGRDAVKKIFTPVARAGITLVSGLASGIDSEVHRAALENGAKTVAVLGNEINKTYPSNNAELRRKIEANGCVVSEYPPHAGSQRYMFPQRNRIISGLSRAVVIFEAAKKSGTMITANWALDDGRDVFAVPGSIFSEKSDGTNYLIKSGAIPVTDAADIFDYLGVTDTARFTGEEKSEAVVPKLTGTAKKICDCLREGEMTVDELLAKTGVPAHELFASLTELEVDGIAEAAFGSRYRLK